MHYCTAPKNTDGTTVIVMILPLSVVNLFDPRNPPPDSFGCDDSVQIGWVMTDRTIELPWTPAGENASIDVTVPVFEAPPPPPDQTAAQLVSSGQRAVQATMDTIAQTRNYNNMDSLCSYASSLTSLIGDTLQFQQEGNAGYTYRSQVWSAFYAWQSTASAKSATTIELVQQAAIAAMPTFTWPDGYAVSPINPTVQSAPVTSITGGTNSA